VGSLWSLDLIGVDVSILDSPGSGPGDVGRKAIALQDLPLLHRHPVAGGGALSRRGPDALVWPAAIGVGPGVDWVSQDLEDGQQDRTPPLQVAAIRSVERTEPEPDVVADQVVEDSPRGAEFVVLVEDETDDLADLLIRSISTRSEESLM